MGSRPPGSGSVSASRTRIACSIRRRLRLGDATTCSQPSSSISARRPATSTGSLPASRAASPAGELRAAKGPPAPRPAPDAATARPLGARRDLPVPDQPAGGIPHDRKPRSAPACGRRARGRATFGRAVRHHPRIARPARCCGRAIIPMRPWPTRGRLPALGPLADRAGPRRRSQPDCSGTARTSPPADPMLRPRQAGGAIPPWAQLTACADHAGQRSLLEHARLRQRALAP